MIMVDKENNISGNTALAPEYAPSTDEKHNKELEKYKKIKIKNKKERQRRLKFKFKTIRNIIIFFAMGITIVGRYSMIYSMQKKSNDLQKQLNEVNKNTENLKVQLVKQSNLSVIEKEALSKLKMVNPDKNTALYTDLSYDNFSKENSDINKSNKESNSWFSKFFKGIKEMLF